MMTCIRMALAATALSLAAVPAFADAWTLDPEMSSIAFGSIKNAYNGEVHHFSSLSGGVEADGQVTIEIPLASVETMIDIRNERMREIVFANTPAAVITASFDRAAVEALGVGEAMVTETDATLAFLGRNLALSADLFVMRAGENTVLVTTDRMLMVATDELGVDESITRLQEIAGLDSIARVTPVTLRFVFTAAGSGN